jgi:hypothetical protein
MQEGMMEKRYIVSAGLSAIERISFCALCGILAISWLFAVCSGLFVPGSAAFTYVWLALYNSLTFLFLAIVRLVVARDMLKTVWDVSDTSVVRKSPSRIMAVDFDRITRFRYYHVPFLFSAGLIKHPQGTLVLSFYIENLDSLITDVRSGLKRAQNTKAFSESNLENFLGVARMARIRYDRVKRFMPSLLSALLISLCISTVTSLFLWHFALAQAFVWTAFVLLIFLIALIGAEARLSFGAGRRDSALDRHPREVQAYLVAGLIAFVMWLFCGILLSTAFAR